MVGYSDNIELSYICMYVSPCLRHRIISRHASLQCYGKLSQGWGKVIHGAWVQVVRHRLLTLEAQSRIRARDCIFKLAMAMRAVEQYSQTARHYYSSNAGNRHTRCSCLYSAYTYSKQLSVTAEVVR